MIEWRRVSHARSLTQGRVYAGLLNTGNRTHYRSTLWPFEGFLSHHLLDLRVLLAALVRNLG